MARKSASKRTASTKTRPKKKSSVAHRRKTTGAASLDYVRTANEATATVRKRAAGRKKAAAKQAPDTQSKSLKREGDKLSHAVRIAAEGKENA